MENFTIKKPIFYTSLILMLFTTFQFFGQCPNIIWQDEFEGTELNLANWNYQIGDGCDQNLCGWGNGELQSYQQDNVSVSNGTLKITARKERIRGTQYTSGRINSKGKADFTYGRFEASIKLPAGDGLWPAFWMLSTNEEYGGWPQSGEIDIMEYVASNPDEVLGYIHYGDLYPNNQSQGNTYQLQNDVFYNSFHEFAIEWEPGEIRWYMDGILFSTKTPEDISPANWPFDKDFHFLLNVAVGGNLGGEVNDNMLPATMEVDYVRVYDGFKAYITGDKVVSNQETGVNYSLGNLGSGTNVNWTVPSDATIVSGQGTNSITVDFGAESGQVSASFNNGCEDVNLSMGIEVEPPYTKSYTFENFDNASTATFVSSTGTLSEVTNPAPNTVNSSSLSGKYDRNAQEQYDLIVYDVTTITDASLYVDKSRKFYIDVYTDAPIGTDIILQLETADATATNYPSGRHSRYVTSITENGNWHRLEFNLLDRPDGGASDSAVENMLLLFNSNTFTGDTYYFDNLDSYELDSGGGETNQSPVIAISNPSDGASFATGSTLSITADASDSDGSVSQVEFFVNGNSIGVDSTTPYSLDWQVAEGSSEITAMATDNENSSTTSAIVTVTGESTGSATSLFVQSIVTGTADAGKGAKYGTATVTIHNNLGQPVQGATVIGTFYGSFTSQVSAVTGSNGTATLQSISSAKGSVIVDLCVDNVEFSGLAYDSNANVITCTGSAQKSSTQKSNLKIDEPQEDKESIDLLLTPNPTHSLVQFSLEGLENASNISIYDMNGKLMLRKNIKNNSGEFDISDYPSGIYIVRVQDEANQIKTMKLVKK